jgi:hypothetical protein
MDLIRDVLDKQLRDRNMQNMGKVDGIVLELRDNAPPRVAYLEVGPPVVARRLGERFSAWIARIDRRFGDGRGIAYRIPWSLVRPGIVDLEVNVDVEETPAYAFERWLRRTIVCRIPGA